MPAVGSAGVAGAAGVPPGISGVVGSAGVGTGAAGFAGIDNPLYYLDKTLMLFGDAKSFVGSIVREVGGGHE